MRELPTPWSTWWNNPRLDVRAHEVLNPPWVERDRHRAIAQWVTTVANDVIKNERWGSGAEGQPAYHVDTGEYMGDPAAETDDNNVPSSAPHDSFIVLHVPEEPDHRHVAEGLYLTRLPGARCWMDAMQRLGTKRQSMHASAAGLLLRMTVAAVRPNHLYLERDLSLLVEAALIAQSDPAFRVDAELLAGHPFDPYGKEE